MYLSTAFEPADLGGRQHVRQGAETVEQHCYELDDKDDTEKDYEQHTNRLELQVLFGDKYLK